MNSKHEKLFLIFRTLNIKHFSPHWLSISDLFILQVCHIDPSQDKRWQSMRQHVDVRIYLTLFTEKQSFSVTENYIMKEYHHWKFSHYFIRIKELCVQKSGRLTHSKFLRFSTLNYVYRCESISKIVCLFRFSENAFENNIVLWGWLKTDHS